MKTTNIISTPEITGNIGSCTSQGIEVQTGYNLLKADFKTIVTNSCTGEVSSYDSWRLADFTSISIMTIVMILIITIIAKYGK